MTKRQIKAAYVKADIFLGEAIEGLMFDHGLDRGEALKYLGL